MDEDQLNRSIRLENYVCCLLRKIHIYRINWEIKIKLNKSISLLNYILFNNIFNRCFWLEIDSYFRMSTIDTSDRPSSQLYSLKLSKITPIIQPIKTISTKEVELQFRVFSYTSQENDGKADNLSLGLDIEGSTGWHSQRFCEYPQEIIILF